MTKDEALKQALVALEDISTALREDDVLGSDIEMLLNAAAAIRVALAQPEQEAVGSVVTYYDSLTHGWFGDPPPEGTLLYIVPPQPEERPWVGLTDEERFEIRQRKWWDWEDAFDIDGFMQAIEIKLKEKNT